jgi:hypothetical protein
VTLVSYGDGESKAQLIRRSQLVPSALDGTAERLAVLFEGGQRAVESQLEAARALVGGERADDAIWDEVRARPRVMEELDPAVAALQERIRAELARP